MTETVGRQRSPVPYLVLVVVGVVVLGAAALLAFDDGDDASDQQVPASVSAPQQPSLPAQVGPIAAGRTPLPGFGEVALTVDDGGPGAVARFCVLAARTEAQRARGLMTVTDQTLGGYDGMVFVFEKDTEGAFWMRNTPMPLSIAYIDRRGRLVDAIDMAPCGDRPDCPNYPPSAPYRLALEVPRGGLARLGVDDDSFVATAGACAPAD